MFSSLLRPGSPSTETAARNCGPRQKPWVMLFASATVALVCFLEVPAAQAQRGPHADFHGRDIAHFGPDELRVWRGGVWRHEWHDGRWGWWWTVDGGWYFYPEPIFPYPTYVPPVIIAQPSPPVVTGLPPAQFWYFCDNPRGYYPYVATCSVPWRAVPVTSSQGN